MKPTLFPFRQLIFQVNGDETPNIFFHSQVIILHVPKQVSEKNNKIFGMFMKLYFSSLENAKCFMFSDLNAF
jgi:hypothetical protein